MILQKRAKVLILRLILKHVAALEIKRFHHSKRNKKGILCEIIMPAAFVCLAMCMTLILPGLEEEPALDMSPWIYPTKVSSPTKPSSPNQFLFSPQNSHHPSPCKALYFFPRVERTHFSLRTTTQSQTGRNDIETLFYPRQGSAPSASMGEK